MPHKGRSAYSSRVSGGGSRLRFRGRPGREREDAREGGEFERECRDRWEPEAGVEEAW